MAVQGIAGLEEEGAEEEAQLDPEVSLAPLATLVASWFSFRQFQKSG